jgi:pimeloyl-ACP methyl ester carboxylesterase
MAKAEMQAVLRSSPPDLTQGLQELAPVLANFEPGHKDGYVNYNNDERAPLLLIAGGEDHLQPAPVNESNFKHYRNSCAVTDYHEFPGRSHYTVGEDGWKEVADYSLEWAESNATQPAPLAKRTDLFPLCVEGASFDVSRLAREESQK